MLICDECDRTFRTLYAIDGWRLCLRCLMDAFPFLDQLNKKENSNDRQD